MATERTIRELGGEVWSELEYHIAEYECNWQVRGKIVDIVMAVLARHENEIIRNDVDLPVKLLPEQFSLSDVAKAEPVAA